MRPARIAVGRNEPCPCGSGRKYKDCCLRRTTVSLRQRSDWLLHKLWTFVLRPHRQQHVLGLAVALSHDEDEVDQLLDLGLPMDLAAFDDQLGVALADEVGCSRRRARFSSRGRAPRVWESSPRAGSDLAPGATSARGRWVILWSRSCRSLLYAPRR
jgi:hypothetical protein